MMIRWLKPFFSLFMAWSLSIHSAKAIMMAPGEVLAPDAAQVINIPVQTDICSLEPDQIHLYWEYMILDSVLEPLVRFASERHIVPAAATHWSPNPEKTVWHFHLRKDGRWSNGDPVIAQDFVRTYQNYCDPKHRTRLHRGFLNRVPLKNAQKVFKGELSTDQLGIRAVDPYTLALTFETPVEEKFLLAALTHPMFAPIHPKFLAAIQRKQREGSMLCRAPRGHASIFSVHPVDPEAGSTQKSEALLQNGFIGNGPFMITEMRFGTQVKAEKNPFYWDAENIVLKKVNWEFTHLTTRDFWARGLEDFWNLACIRGSEPCPQDLRRKVFGQ